MPPGAGPATGSATAAAVPRPLASDLHWVLIRLARGLGVAEEKLLGRHGLSLRGYLALSEIVGSPARSQLAISRAIRVLDPSTLVGVLDELETAGFVTRTPDPSDRRARLVTTTEAGLAALLAANADVRRVEDELLGGIPAGQRAQICQVLRQAVDHPLAQAAGPGSC